MKIRISNSLRINTDAGILFKSNTYITKITNPICIFGAARASLKRTFLFSLPALYFLNPTAQNQNVGVHIALYTIL